MRDLIGKETSEELLGARDAFKQAKILDANPALLSNDDFEKWVVAYGKVRVLELLEESKPVDKVMEIIRREVDTARSKQQVNVLRLDQSNRDHEKLVKRNRDYRPTVDPDRGE